MLILAAGGVGIVNATLNVTTHLGHDNRATLLAIFSPFVFLFLGASIKHLFSRLPVPYTVMLLGLGLAIGALEKNTSVLGDFGDSSRIVANLDPHLFLYIFLPPLIFESAFSLEWHMFKQTWQQAVILAGPGILIASGITGACTKLMLYPEWTWEVVLLFGAILSATDPVAVVALLKDLGAKKSLAALIEGESLMNDGTAVVVFTVLLKAAQAGHLSANPGAILWTFVKMALGGALWGLTMGVASVWWLGYVFNNAMVEISITLCAAYLTFFVAEFFLHVSGVLALVVMGVYYGSIGRTSISPDIEEFLHEFWEMLAYMANTLVFVMTGVIIANTSFNVQLVDWFLALLLYLICHVARLLTFLALSPALRRYGYGLSYRELLVCVWGGLRGAVGLALALVVFLDPSITHHYSGVNNRVLFHTAAIVCLTLLVNSTTIKALLTLLRMDRVAAAKEHIFRVAMDKFASVGDAELQLLKGDPLYRCASWPEVRKYRFTVPDVGTSVAAEQSEQDMLQRELHEARRRFLVTVKASYWKQFKSGLLGRHAVRDLIEATDQSLDSGCDMEEWRLLRNSLKVPYASLLNKLMFVPATAKLARSILFNRLQYGYDIASSYLVAREEATDLLTKFLESEKIFEAIKAHAQQDICVVKKALFGLQRSFPEISASIATNHAARTVLNCQKREVHHLHEEGMLDDTESERMAHAIGAQMKRLLFSPPPVSLPTKEELLKEVAWLETVAPDIVAEIADIARERMLAFGDVALTQGEPGTDMWVVARGTVEVVVQAGSGSDGGGGGGTEVVIDELGVGSFIGEMSWVTNQPNFATVRASSAVILLQLSGAQLRGVVEKHPSLEYSLWRATGSRVAEHLLSRQPPFDTWPRRGLRKWVATWRLFSATPTRLRAKFKQDTALVFGSATVVMHATGEEGDQTFRVEAPCIIRSQPHTDFYSCALTQGSQILYPPNSRVTMAASHWKKAFRVLRLRRPIHHHVGVKMMGLGGGDHGAAHAQVVAAAQDSTSRAAVGRMRAAAAGTGGRTVPQRNTSRRRRRVMPVESKQSAQTAGKGSGAIRVATATLLSQAAATPGATLDDSPKQAAGVGVAVAVAAVAEQATLDDSSGSIESVVEATGDRPVAAAAVATPSAATGVPAGGAAAASAAAGGGGCEESAITILVHPGTPSASADGDAVSGASSFLGSDPPPAATGGDSGTGSGTGTGTGSGSGSGGSGFSSSSSSRPTRSLSSRKSKRNRVSRRRNHGGSHHSRGASSSSSSSDAAAATSPRRGGGADAAATHMQPVTEEAAVASAAASDASVSGAAAASREE